MLPSCALCQRTDPQRMIALMAIWFGRLAGLPSDGGYFYLCPTCYARHIEPHVGDVVSRLVEQHPFLHRLAAAQDVHRRQPARQAGAHPVAVDVPENAPATGDTSAPARAGGAPPPEGETPPAPPHPEPSSPGTVSAPGTDAAQPGRNGAQAPPADPPLPS